MKRKNIFLAALIICMVCIMPGYSDFTKMAAEMMNNEDWSQGGEEKGFTLVIDPGHGGMDGGAEASDGTQEKNINLAIAHFLKEEAKKYGVNVVMTRETDACLRSEEGGSLSDMKIRDLHERKRIIDEANPDITVSIHLNSFKQDERVRGVQVFYPSTFVMPQDHNEKSPADTSKEIAALVQTEIEKNIDYGKKRTPMEKNDIYILKNIYTPIILVECGFLSNYSDKAITKNPKFQQKIAGSIMLVLANYFHLNELKNMEITDSRHA